MASDSTLLISPKTTTIRTRAIVKTRRTTVDKKDFARQTGNPPLLTVLAAAFLMVTPLFPRRYDWDVPQWEILWGAILLAGRTGATHDLRVITHISGDSAGGGARRLVEIVDGQERLVTIFHLLADIAVNVANDQPEKVRACFPCNVVETRVEGVDDPPLIFESLNAREEVLTPRDLVRKFLLTDQPPALRGRIFGQYGQ